MKICIYGAALDEIPENYRKGAEDFGRALAKRGHSLLFGGGKHGCMGAVARGVAAEGGEVSAITPDFLNQGDDLFQPCHRVVRTRDLAERKRLFSVRCCNAEGFNIRRFDTDIRDRNNLRDQSLFDFAHAFFPPSVFITFTMFIEIGHF